MGGAGHDVGVFAGMTWVWGGTGRDDGRGNDVVSCIPPRHILYPITSCPVSRHVVSRAYHVFMALSRHSREGGNPVVRHRANGKGIESLSCSHTHHRPGAGILWISRNTIGGYERIWICGCSE